MSPRQQPRDDSPPDQVGVLGGGGASGDRLYEIATKVSGIERSATTLEGFASDAKSQLRDLEKQLASITPVLSNFEKCIERIEAKLSKLQDESIALNTKIDTLKPIANSVGKGIWGIILLLVSFVLTVLGMWIKHKYWP